MGNEGEIRYFLSNWTDRNESPTAWIGANTGAVFFTPIASFATVSSLVDMEPEGLAYVDALMYPPPARGKIVTKLTDVYTELQKLPVLGSSYKAITSTYKVLSQTAEGKSVLWDEERNLVQAIAFLCSFANEVHDPDDILPLLHGAIERMPESHMLDGSARARIEL